MERRGRGSERERERNRGVEEEEKEEENGGEDLTRTDCEDSHFLGLQYGQNGGKETPIMIVHR